MGPLNGLPTKAWDASFGLNVRSAYFCTREAGRHLLAQRSGAIVNVSSAAGVAGVKGGAHYASSKAALQMFTTVTAAEWGRYGIRANCVAVGLDRLGARRRSLASGQARHRLRPPRASRSAAGNTRRSGQRHPLPGQRRRVAYITGQTFAVDGGPRLGGIEDV